MKIKTGTALGVIAAVAVACIGGGYMYVSRAKKEFAAQESALPESAISAYFKRLNTKDYDGIYQDSQMVAPHMNSEEDYTAALEKTYSGINTSDISYSGQDNGDGSMTYSLYDKNGNYLANLKLIQNSDGKWVASTVFQGDESYQIEAPKGVTVSVNGIQLDDSYKVRGDLELHSSAFTGLNDQSLAPVVDLYEVDNLLSAPIVEVAGDSSYTTMTDVLTNHILIGKTIDDADLKQMVIDDAETCAKFPAQETSVGAVQAISVPLSDWYKRISGMQNTWFTSHSTSNFSNQNVLNMIQLDDNTMIAQVVFDYYASNGEVERTWHGGYQMSFLNQNGSWKIAGMAIDNELNPERKQWFDNLNQ